jgi:hypothetical protein
MLASALRSSATEAGSAVRSAPAQPKPCNSAPYSICINARTTLTPSTPVGGRQPPPPAPRAERSSEWTPTHPPTPAPPAVRSSE